MGEENEFISSKDGLKLYLHHWVADSPNKLLCIVHGLGEHGGRYETLSDFFVSQNTSVMAIDLRGHGRSEGKRGHSKTYDLLLSDIEEMLKAGRLAYTDLPIYLYGHSLGGNLVANYVHTRPSSELSGFVLSAPFFKVAFDPPGWKVRLATWVGLLFPAITQSNELNPESISSIAEEVEKYTQDPLVHDKISIQLFLDATENGIKALQHNEPLKLNGLVFQGTEDRITSIDATSAYADFHSENVTFRKFDNVYHEPHNDVSRDEVYELVRNFMS